MVLAGAFSFKVSFFGDFAGFFSDGMFLVFYFPVEGVVFEGEVVIDFGADAAKGQGEAEGTEEEAAA